MEAKIEAPKTRTFGALHFCITVLLLVTANMTARLGGLTRLTSHRVMSVVGCRANGRYGNEVFQFESLKSVSGPST
jgi:hypothetical protein